MQANKVGNMPLPDQRKEIRDRENRPAATESTKRESAFTPVNREPDGKRPEVLTKQDSTAKKTPKVSITKPEPSPQPPDLMRDLLDAKYPSNHQGNTTGVVDADMSDAQTVFSTASSAITLVDPAAAETFARGIMKFQSLGYLWPQLVGRCDTKKRCIHVIERLLKRYSKDLALVSDRIQASKMSGSQLCLTAARFVRKSRIQVAQKIWEEQVQGTNDLTGKDAVEGLLDIEVPDLEVDEDDNIPTIDDLSFETIEEILFDKSPIFSLQANIKQLINLSDPMENSNVYRLSACLNIFIGNTISSLCEPSPSPGYTRLRYTCKCGRRLYDDFKEVQPGALTRLENLLASYFGEHPITIQPEDFEPTPTADSPNKNKTLGSLMSVWKGLFGARQKDGRPPWTRQSRNNMELSICSTGTSNGTVDHRFVLMCLPFMRWAKKLHQLDMCNLQSDQVFFLSLRKQYSLMQKSRPLTSFARFRRVNSLDFVKFEVYRNEFVDIHDNPSVPDREDKEHAKQNYTYDPLPAHSNPPIGPNLLMHMFQHPEHADAEPVLYRKIPKKLHAKLEPCPVKGSAIGWGVHFTEGVDWVVLFAYGCIGFSSALVFAMAWSIARGDIQSGFAVGSFMVTFVGFCLGIARTEIQLGM